MQRTNIFLQRSVIPCALVFAQLLMLVVLDYLRLISFTKNLQYLYAVGLRSVFLSAPPSEWI